MSIGETLARARERAGLTVASISQRTRIRETLIRAIEDDDFSSCGGDFYARGHIRSIAAAVGTDPEPLVWEYDKTYGAQEAITAADAFEPVRPVRMRGRRGSRWPILLLVLLVVAVGATGYFLIAHSSGASHVPQASQTHRPVTKHHASAAPKPSQQTTPPASPTPAPPSSPPVRTLTPASVTAFGPGGSGQGDNAQLARQAMDGRSGAWHTDWYTSADFGGLQHGTGLLLNMGRRVTITSARIMLGGGGGAALQLRAGDAPSLSQLKQVAQTGNASGVVNLRLATATQGRYLLIWITKLPQDSSGTFQASVSGIRVSGRA